MAICVQNRCSKPAFNMLIIGSKEKQLSSLSLQQQETKILKHFSKRKKMEFK
jgi:hypothetical protein